MKNNILKYRIILVWSLLFCLAKGYSQQDPQFTQYMYNMSVINPAYATADEGIVNIGGLYRTQWVGIDGGPNTATFFAHTPLNERVEVVLPVSDDAKLSLGLKGGFTFFDANFNGFNLQSGDVSTDVAFNQNVSKTFPNIGLGAFYFTDRFYAGLSAPNLLTTKHIETENGIKATGVQDIHLFLTGGYVFDFVSDLKLKPSIMVRGVRGAPLAIDLNANVLINEKLEAGLGYRLNDSFSAMVNFKVAKDLRIGYAYDHTISNLGTFNSGSHELIVLFDFDLFNFETGYDRSPRFF